MKKTILIIIVLFILIVGGAYYFQMENVEDPEVSEEIEDVEAPEDMILTRKVYFGITMDGQERVEFVTRDFPVPTDDRETTLYKLLEGPTEAEKERGYVTAINEGVSINEFYIENGVAYVDFSEELDASGSATATMIRDQIEKTLLQFDDIRDVIISIEGETDEILQP